jgi:DNA polymerase III delta prime subunit
MAIDTHTKYRPKSINEFIFWNAELEKIVRGYASGSITRPLILYGPYGTGKSLLAELIPKAIDGENVKVNQVSFNDLNSPKEVIQHFERPKTFDLLFCDNKHRNYHVIDELGFKERASGALRIMLEKYEETDLVIMTTNRLDRVDDGIRSRCHCVVVMPLAPEQFLDRAVEILVNEGLPIERNKVLELLRRKHQEAADNREFYKLLDKMLLERAVASVA